MFPRNGGWRPRRPSMKTLLVGFSLAGGAALLVYDFAFFGPTARRLANAQAELLRRERTLALSGRLAGEHPRVLARLHVNDMTALARLGLSNPAVELLTTSAAAHGLELQLVEPSPVQDTGDARRSPVELRLAGAYDALLAWLHEVESSQVLVTVDRVYIEGAPSGQHVIRVTLSTYTVPKAG